MATVKQLNALAIYRTHKHCECSDCEIARQALKEYDANKWNRRNEVNNNAEDKSRAS